MEWMKEIGSRGGADGGWRDDFPLSSDLPLRIGVNCKQLKLPIHPMWAIRLRVFMDWHRQEEREVTVVPPDDAHARLVFSGLGLDGDSDSAKTDSDSILPVTRLDGANAVEDVAKQTREILEYQLPDLSPLGHAAFMAVSELCDNAVDHGRNTLGAYIAVRRIIEPRRQVSIAIGDLGIGIPEHIRQRYPEWSDDGYAIAHATQPHVTGTGNNHRGIGFSEVFDAALTTSMHAAKMDIHSANGFFRLQVVQESPKPEVFPAARFRRGSWISYELVSV
jgi:hypothetical protein